MNLKVVVFLVCYMQSNLSETATLGTEYKDSRDMAILGEGSKERIVWIDSQV